jgi:hypothetical protein
MCDLIDFTMEDQEPRNWELHVQFDSSDHVMNVSVKPGLTVHPKNP